MEVGEGRVVTLLAGDYELELAEGQGGMELASEALRLRLTAGTKSRCG